MYALVKLLGCSYTANKTPTFVRRAYRAKRELNKAKCVQIYRHIYYVIVWLFISSHRHIRYIGYIYIYTRMCVCIIISLAVLAT